jgi:two-component system OmpR family response regulator
MKKMVQKILFVDDDPDIHLIVKMSLQAIPKLELQSAYSGEEAIKVVMEFQPDLILLDVMMPKMDGIATLQAIKLIPSVSHIPVIFLTAKAQKSEVEEYFKYGIIDVIVKPFDPTSLPQIIQKIWEKWSAAF